MAKLYLKFESAVIKEISLNKDEMTFGRKPTNDIVIDHAAVSGFHGKIRKDGDHFIVEDLNSTNGTFVNGQRIKSNQLKDKDQIGIARHIMEFRLSDSAPSSMEVPPAEPSSATPTMATTPPPAAPPPPSAPPPPAAVTPPVKEPPKEKSGEADSNGIPKNLAAASKLILQPEAKKEEKTEAPVVPTGLVDVSQEGMDGPPKTVAGGAGVVKVVSGGVDGFSEIRLKELVTYIGTSDKAAIKIKGFLAPSLAAAISRRPEGYFLKAVKPGYPKVNGNAVQEQIFLENGALIEVGGTNMVFYQSDAKKTDSQS